MRVPWEKLEEAFEQCHALAGEERRAYLNELAKRDTELFVELRKLLDADDLAAADSFFEPGALKAASLLKDHFVGKQIGTFAITELIGEGGMGAVYRAEQTRPFHRLAAIKVIWAANTNEHLLRRFDVEVQTLARLNHPNIASVYFSGVTDNGLPYFCMELVDGLSLDVYCRENSLGVADRLKIFAEICRAVHFAHQRGVIHRDIKPANILIAEVDGRPQVKMIDFGIAKAVQDDKQIEHSFQVTATLLTIPGMAVGTLGYMSPEQTLVSDQDVDLRTDVYALGVVLYELLVGDLPISRRTISEKSWDQIFKAIRDKTPTIPSQAVLSVEENPHGQAGLGKPALSKKYRGDIDWMVMKALAKEPDRRYESALAFAEDCERHLANEPVLARPPSLGYQISRFVKRNKGLSAGLAVVLSALFVGVVGLGAGYYQAKQAEKRMQEEVETANTTVKVLEEFIISVAPNREGTEVKMIDRLKNFSPRIDELNLDDAIRGKLHFTVGRAFRSIGHYDEALDHFSMAEPLIKKSYGSSSKEAFDVERFLIESIGDLRGGHLARKARMEIVKSTAVDQYNSLSMFYHCTSLSYSFSKSLSFAESKRFLNLAEEILEKYHKDDDSMLGKLYQVKAVYYQYRCENDKAIKFFLASSSQLESLDSVSLLLIDNYADVSCVLNEIGDYIQSDFYIDKARRMSIEIYGEGHPEAHEKTVLKVHNLIERKDYEGALDLGVSLFNLCLKNNLVEDNIHTMYLLQLLETAAARSGNKEAFLVFMGNFNAKYFGYKNEHYCFMVQNGTYGTVLYNNGETKESLSLLLSAYELSEEMDHYLSSLASEYALTLSFAFYDIGDYASASDWSCIAISHFDQTVCDTYDPPMIEYKTQWVKSLLKSKHEDGPRELSKVISEATQDYGVEHDRTKKLLELERALN